MIEDVKKVFSNAVLELKPSCIRKDFFLYD